MSIEPEPQRVRNQMAGLHLAAVAAGIVGLLLLLGWCIGLAGGSERKPDNPAKGAATRATVIQIVLEGVHPEDLTKHALQGVVMPVLGGLARESTWFDRHWSQSNGTSAAFASLLTGLYSSRHGLGSARRLGREGLSSKVTLLSEDLAAAEFATLASVATPQFSSEFSGFDQGWERFAAPRFTGPVSERNAEAVVGAVREEFRAMLASPAPVYALFEFRDPCEPFEAPARFEARALVRHLSEFVEEVPELRDELELARSNPKAGVAAIRKRLARRRGHAAWDALRAGQREAEFAYLDEQIAALFELLDQHDRYSNALIVVSGNVGTIEEESPRQTLFGRFQPSRMRVPLLIRLPGGERSTPVQALTCSIDVRATILDVLGVPCADSDGKSLLAQIRAPRRGAPLHDCVLFEDCWLGEAAAVDDFWFVQSRPNTVPVPLEENRTELMGTAIPPVPKARLKQTREALAEFAKVAGIEVELSAGLRTGYELKFDHRGGTWLDGKLEGERARALGQSEWFGSARSQVEVALAAWGEGGASAQLHLSADRESPAYTLRLRAVGGDLDEELIRFGDRPLSRLAIPRVPASHSSPWNFPATSPFADPLVDITRDSGRWLKIRVGGKPGQAAELLVVGAPEGDETWDELLVDQGGFEEQPVEGRPDCRWITGQTPLTVRVKPIGSNALGLSVALEGEQVPSDRMRYQGRHFSDFGEVNLAIPDWLPGVHEHLERIAEAERRAPEPGVLWFGHPTQRAFPADQPVPGPALRKALSRLGDFE